MEFRCGREISLKHIISPNAEKGYGVAFTAKVPGVDTNHDAFKMTVKLVFCQERCYVSSDCLLFSSQPDRHKCFLLMTQQFGAPRTDFLFQSPHQLPVSLQWNMGKKRIQSPVSILSFATTSKCVCSFGTKRI